MLCFGKTHDKQLQSDKVPVTRSISVRSGHIRDLHDNFLNVRSSGGTCAKPIGPCQFTLVPGASAKERTLGIIRQL